VLKKNIKSIAMMEWAKSLFPINRSITGAGLRQTINYIRSKINKGFQKKKIKSNTKVFDWKIPNEWKINSAYIKYIDGKKICDFKDNNLHILGYSTKINRILTYKQLKKNIFFSKKTPNAIPYYTSYYKKNWGFCLSYNNFKKLKKNSKYKVVINSSHFKGHLDFTELVIKGKSSKEILIVSYICHPSMANNELSGPLIIMALSKLLRPMKYTIRLVLIPETIGAIAYIKLNFSRLKKNLIAGFNLTCVGDSGPFTLISSKEGNTYSDKIAKRILSKTPKFKVLSFLSRGSNERQFGCQNLSLPFVTICRSRFGDYKQYHSSDDNLKLISENNLKNTLRKMLLIIEEIQKNKIFYKTFNCEPFFSKHKLVRTTRKTPNSNENDLFNLSAYVDRNYDEVELAKLLNKSRKYIRNKIKILLRNKIIQEFI
tara:strand:+ start:28545 stop:29828 length:1284 start_codon:yes stop_codon:yes gene_type:complete